MEITEHIYGDEWVLDSNKVAFLPGHECMLIADLHLGKLRHFRGAGIGLPVNGEQKNFDRLQHLILFYKPKKLFFLGDLFHSKENSVWIDFKHFLGKNSLVNFVLVLGNHDVFVDDQFDFQKNLTICQNYELDKYLLSHEPMNFDSIPNGKINICGHIHPAVSLKGKGKQRLTLSCFLFKSNQCIMPAFGEFTGNFVIETKKADIVIGLGNNEIFRIN